MQNICNNNKRRGGLTNNWMSPFKIVACNGHSELAYLIAKNLDIPLSKTSIISLPNGELLASIGESFRDQDVYIIQSSHGRVNELLMELLIMISGCKSASARRITVVIPCFPYSRQDKKDKGRCPITAKLVANLLTSAGADHIMTMELHADQIKGFFKNIAVDNLLGLPTMINYVRQNIHNYEQECIVVAPDAGGVKRCTAVADALGLGFAIIHKERKVANQVSRMMLIGDVKDKVCIMIDDMADTCGTLCSAAKILKENKAKAVLALVVHPILSSGAVRRINDSDIEKIVVCNTVPLSKEAKASDKIVAVDISKLFSEAIRRNHSGQSISFLFKYVPTN